MNNTGEQMYQVIKETLGAKPKFIPYPLANLPITDRTKDYYVSLFQYTEAHKKQAEERGTLAGIKDTTTNALYFDFDSKDNLELAKSDALELATRLVDKGIAPEDVAVSFTGSKGFSISVFLKERISNLEFKAAVQRLAGDLESFDHVVSDPNRIIRVDNTKHQKTGNYKIPLELYELDEFSIDKILELSKNPRESTKSINVVTLPKELFVVKEKLLTKTEASDDLKEALANKPRHWKDYKYALVQGFFEPGERHSALMVIAATCRGLGYDKNTAYYMCKSALKKQAARSGSDEFPKEELWENIIENSVYSDNWEGGQYSPSTNPWLKKYCIKMGFDTSQKEDADKPSINFEDMTGDFSKFAHEFEKNILKTGIDGLDNNVILSTSTLNGLLGNPGSGKTSMALNYLKHTSMQGTPSMFFSLDMGKQLVYSKLVQKETKLDFKKTLSLYRDDPERAAKVADKLKQEYRNVGFNFRAGLSVADIRRAIQEHQESIGQKVKLVIIDYLECIASGMADPTAGAGLIANQLKDVANEEEVCILLLLQTQKHSTPDVSDPLLSLKGVKGSSLIEQSCSTILTLWREGYNPKYVNDDKYISFAVVKNRFGNLWTGDFGWNGVTGNIRSLTEEEQGEFKDFKKRKKEEKYAAEKESSEGWK